jgi:hypothetical protein
MQSQSFDIKVEAKDSLYYSKYKYKIALNIRGVRFTRYAKNTVDVAHRVRMYERASDTNYDYDTDVIEKFIHWRNANVKRWNNNTCDNAILSVEYYGKVTAFSNDLDVLKELALLSEYPNQAKFYEATGDAPPDVKYFNTTPKYKFRTYFKGVYINAAEKDEIRKFFSKNKPAVASQALDRWLFGTTRPWNTNTVSSHFFFDYDDTKMLTIAKLTLPSIIAKTFKMQKRPA